MRNKERGTSSSLLRLFACGVKGGLEAPPMGKGRRKSGGWGGFGGGGAFANKGEAGFGGGSLLGQGGGRGGGWRPPASVSGDRRGMGSANDVP